MRNTPSSIQRRPHIVASSHALLLKIQAPANHASHSQSSCIKQARRRGMGILVVDRTGEGTSKNTTFYAPYIRDVHGQSPSRRWEEERCQSLRPVSKPAVQRPMKRFMPTLRLREPAAIGVVSCSAHAYQAPLPTQVRCACPKRESLDSTEDYSKRTWQYATGTCNR